MLKGMWILSVMAAGLSAQTMPYSLAYVYTAVSETGDGFSVTATTVSNTYGSSGHTSAAMVWLRAPDGRDSGANSYHSYMSQATTYIGLCVGDTCYDGFATAGSEGTQEYCPIAGQTLEPAPSGDQVNVTPYAYLSRVAFSKPRLGLAGDSGTFTVTAGKSQGCGSSNATVQANVSSSTQGLQFYFDGPPNNPKQVNFTGFIAQGGFTIGTQGGNQIAGSIDADGLLVNNSSGCRQISELKQMEIPVN
jgi:hypothetical protein